MSCLKVCTLLICCAVVSQTQAQTVTHKSSDKTPAPIQNEVEQFRRVTAIALITSLAEEARDYRDESLRVRIQARAAEALWKTDQERALSLFYRAWDTADTIDKAAEQRNREDRKKFLSGQGQISFISPRKNLRLEVLRFAARCNRELGEEFLNSLQEEKKSDESDVNASAAANWDPTEPPLALNKRLEVANLLLEGGEVEKALRFADSALERVTSPGITFLYKLRQINPNAADQRFSTLLMRTAVDPLADANSISLLSSYAFTPLIFATVTRNGRAYGGDPFPPPVLSPDVRASFFRVAAQVLLRPLSASGQDFTSAGRAGTYFVIARLLPLFERYASEKVPELTAYLTALSQDAPDSLRNDYTMRTAGFNSEGPSTNDTEVLLNQLGRASSNAERDRIYLNALSGVVKIDPARGREIADKIEDSDLRKRCRAFVDFVAVRTALERRNTDAVLRIVRAGELPPIQKVWAYSEVAQVLKSDPISALQILSEASTEARRIDQNDSQRVQALTAIATGFLLVDRALAWETMGEAVKAASHIDEFKGETGKVTANLKTGSMVTAIGVDVPSFNLAGIFTTLAKEDLQRAIDLAKGFLAPEPRAIAVLAISQSVLAEKQK